jgi:SAM-dependent methyltransferase
MNRDQYFPQVFIPQNIEHAKEIILSTDPTGEKWIRETDATAMAIRHALQRAQVPLTEQSLLLDYGCGIGRVAKKMIELSGCTVLGLDISPGMLYCSLPYVNSDRFIPCPQNRIRALAADGLKVDAAMAIWTLQHCLHPLEDVAMIHEILKPGGLFFVANKYDRYLPVTPLDSNIRWHDDKIDILKCIGEYFDLVESVSLGDATQEYYRVYRN